jgi:predicted ATPase
LATAHESLGRFDDARRGVREAIKIIETTKQVWCEAEVHRVAGEIALKSSEADVTEAQAYFEHALSVARAQQAKSWELRAAMSMARLWRDQGKRDEARDLLAPVHGWFTEGFDTRDLKDAKALLSRQRKITRIYLYAHTFQSQICGRCYRGSGPHERVKDHSLFKGK